MMHPTSGRDFSRGPKEFAALLYIAVLVLAIWRLGLWRGLGIFFGILALRPIVSGWREGRRQARAIAIREGRRRHPVLIVADAAERGDVDVLVAALSDPEGRGSAALALGDMRARRAVPQLIQNLRVHDDLDRNGAVMALGKIGDPAAIPRLRELADADPAAGVRTTAINALAMLGESRAREQLGQLAVDPDPVWRSADRYFDLPMLSGIRPGYSRSTRRWAARRIRELDAIEALPVLTSATRRGGVVNRMRLRRTARRLARDH
jgi:hypothetical protein